MLVEKNIQNNRNVSNLFGAGGVPVGGYVGLQSLNPRIIILLFQHRLVQGRAL